MVQRKATADTHISEYTLPKFSEKFWNKLQRIIDLSLNEQDKNRIKSTVNRYVERSYSLQDGRARKALFTRLRKDKKSDLIKFRESLKQLLEHWETANQDEHLQRMLSDFEAEIKIRSKGSLDLSETMMNLETLSFSFELYLKDIQKNIQPVASESASTKLEKSTIASPESIYINELADIFRALGVKVSKTVKTVNSISPSLFVQIIEHINTFLDKDLKVRNHSIEALEKVIQRTLEN